MATHISSSATDFARCGAKSGLVIHHMCLNNPEFRATFDCPDCQADLDKEQASSVMEEKQQSP